MTTKQLAQMRGMKGGFTKTINKLSKELEVANLALNEAAKEIAYHKEFTARLEKSMEERASKVDYDVPQVENLKYTGEAVAPATCERWKIECTFRTIETSIRSLADSVEAMRHLL